MHDNFPRQVEQHHLQVTIHQKKKTNMYKNRTIRSETFCVVFERYTKHIHLYIRQS
jgi:hypothetical protein